MVKPKLKERLAIRKAKEEVSQTPTKSKQGKSKSNSSTPVKSNNGKKEESAAAVTDLSSVSRENIKKNGDKDTKKELKNLERMEKKEARREKKKELKELKKKQEKSGEEEEEEEKEESEPRIRVGSLEEEYQKDFAAVVAVDHEDDDEEEEEEEEQKGLDYDALTKSDNESEIDDDEDDEDEDDEDEDDEDEEEDEEKDVAYSDVEFDSDADIVPHTKVTINKTAALEDSYNRIKLPWSAHSFVEHQSVTSEEPTSAGIVDIYDDTERELAFYKQGLAATKEARSTLIGLKVPFSRPADYFAEMLKSDEHMDKLKQKLMKEATATKKSEEAKKQRLLKKFGKKVQIATLQERQKQKRETLDKIKEFRKKRKDGAKAMDDDEFEIAIEENNAAKDEWNDRKRKRRAGGQGRGGDQQDGGNRNKKARRPGKSKRNNNRR